MMVSPNYFVEMHKNESYEQLLKVRDELLVDIYGFEEAARKNQIEHTICPSPEVIYQCNLEYLGSLCNLISPKYNEEYISRDDEEQ
jgi:hypothetical protein